MAQDPKKRQQRLQRQNARRKEKQQQTVQRNIAHRAPSLTKTRNWPLHEALITQTWRDTENLIQILVSRRGPSGYLAVGAFMVDLGCLGVKSAYGRVVDSLTYAETRQKMTDNQRLIRADLNLVAKIVREAIAYAGELGFRPDPDYRAAMIVLGDADPDACDIEIPVGGSDGKPFYFAGPFDNWRQIIAHLTRKLGPDGFHYLVPLQADDLPPGIMLADADESENEDDDAV